MGRKVISTSENVEQRGFSPVPTLVPYGAMASGISPSPKQKTISADSFRKLTSLLKKEPVIPALPLKPISAVPIEAISPIAAPETVKPADVYLAPVPSEITFAPVADVYVAPVLPEVTLAPHIEPEIVPQVIAQVLEPVVFPGPELQSLQQVEFEPEPIQEPEPELVPELIPELVPELAPEPIIAVVAKVAEPAPLRPKLRDAFAQSPAAIPARPAVVATPQTPEQELANAELARSLLDMMASSNSSGLPQERALAADTLLRMLPKLPLKSLVMLSERLCLMEQPPQLIVAKLIADQRVEVSGPLLEDCSHISDETLISVINEGLADKRRMMARRRKISRAISASLIQTADPSVVLTLVRNMNAEIAHESFIELVKFASVHDELLAPLCTRTDLPVPFAFDLFWAAPAQLRRYLLSRFLTDSETLTKILKITLDDQSEANAFPDPELVMQALQLAAEDNLEEASAQLAECAKIDQITAARILTDNQGDPLAALLKAVGIPRSVASKILADAVTTILDPARDPEELQALFDSLSFNKARILLTYWDWSALQSGPYAPLN